MRLRVFLVGVTTEDLNALAARVEGLDALTIVGRGFLNAVQSGASSIPADVDVVMTSRRAMQRGAQVSLERDAPVLVEQLTPRESAVLALVADGLPNRDIARELEISEHTVKFHLASVFGKLGASSRTEAVRRGLELGLIEI